MSLTVRPAPQPLTFLADALPDTALNKPYAAPMPVTGGTPPFRFLLLQGAWPEGLTLDERTGMVTGKPIRPTETPAELAVRVEPASGDARAALGSA